MNINPNLINKLALESGWEKLSSLKDVHSGMHTDVLNLTNTEYNRTCRKHIGLTLENGMFEELQMCAYAEIGFIGYLPLCQVCTFTKYSNLHVLLLLFEKPPARKI